MVETIVLIHVALFHISDVIVNYELSPVTSDIANNRISYYHIVYIVSDMVVN